MNQRGSALGKILIALVAVMVGTILGFVGQIGIALVVIVLAVIFAVAAFWSRVRTSTDTR